MIQETQYQQAKARLAELQFEKVNLEEERKCELAEILSKYGNFDFKVLSFNGRTLEISLEMFEHQPFRLVVNAAQGEVEFNYVRNIHVGEYSPRTEALRMALAIASDGNGLMEYLNRDDGGKMASIESEIAECNDVIWRYKLQEKEAAMAKIEAAIKPNGRMGIAFFNGPINANWGKRGILVTKVTKKRIYGYYVYRDDHYSPIKVSPASLIFEKEKQWDKESVLNFIIKGDYEVVDDIKAEIAK